MTQGSSPSRTTPKAKLIDLSIPDRRGHTRNSSGAAETSTKTADGRSMSASHANPPASTETPTPALSDRAKLKHTAQRKVRTAAKSDSVNNRPEKKIKKGSNAAS